MDPNADDGTRLERSRAESTDCGERAHRTGRRTGRSGGSGGLALLRCGLVCHRTCHEYRWWACSTIGQTMTDATRRVTQWIIGIRGEVPLVEELATAEDVQSFVRGHVRWVDGTPGPAIELEDIDWITVDWNFVLKMMHVAL